MDFCLEANGASADRQCGEVGIRFIQEVLARLPDEDRDLNMSGDLATLYFAVGRDAKGEQPCQELTRAHRDRAVGSVTLASELLRGFRRGLAGRAELWKLISNGDPHNCLFTPRTSATGADHN